MSNAAPNGFQPNLETLRHIAQYLAEREPDHDGDIVVSFTAGQRDAFVDALNSHASLKARAEQAERSVDVLESNAREQAKLVADTGRRVEELEAALRESNDALSDWLAFAEEELGEFDLEVCDFGGAAEALCHKCESSGCINLKIRNTRAALPQSRDVARGREES